MEKLDKIYTAADFERYYLGTMTLQERFALEKAALEDPFLADALEGFEHTSTGAADVAELKKRIIEKTKKKKAAPVFRLSQNSWWRIAAFFILIAGVGLILYNINPSVNRKSLARNEVTISKKSDSEQLLLNQDSMNAVGDMAYGGNAEKNVAVIKEAGASPGYEKKENANPSVMAEVSPVPRLEVSSTILSDQSDKAASGNLKGQVINKDGNVIASAPVQNRMSDVVIMNDSSDYNIVTAETTAKTSLLQKNAGNAPKKSKNDSSQDDDKLSRELSTSVAGIQINKQLNSGNKAFDEYLVKNIQPVYDNAGLPQKGEVLLSFKINKNGDPVNITVEQSTCKSCEIQAIKLLTNGAKWKKEDTLKKVLIQFY